MKKVTDYHKNAVEATEKTLRSLLRDAILDVVSDETEILTVNMPVGHSDTIMNIEPVISDDEKVIDVNIEISFFDNMEFLYYSEYKNLNDAGTDVLLALWEWLKNNE